MPNYRRGQIQLRGRIRWRIKRSYTTLRYGRRTISDLPIVFGNAIPKAGSKLLFNILRSLEDIGPFVNSGLNEIKPFFRGEATNANWIVQQLEALRPGDIRFGYIYGDPAFVSRLTGANRATFLILRDPRDQLISEIFYALDIHIDHALHDYLKSLPDMETRIDVMIRGVKEQSVRRVGVREHYERFAAWWNAPGVCVVRFEDLINRQEMELDRIISHLENRGFHPVLSRNSMIQTLKEAMRPDRSETFRKGKSGAWRDHFTSQSVDIFKRHAGNLLLELGYEKDNNW